MFAAIAPRYDLLNHLLSFNLDRLWRRRAVRSLGLPSGARVLDFASGTGDLALALARAGLRPVGADFCFDMLALARRKEGSASARWVTADALAAPISDQVFDGVTVAFGVRNFEDLDRGLGELHRVLRPGGRIAILEFPPPPPGPFGRIFRFYLRSILPRIGALLSPRAGAYVYLPRSMETFLSPTALAESLARAGFDEIEWSLLTGGAVALHTATRPVR